MYFSSCVLDILSRRILGVTVLKAFLNPRKFTLTDYPLSDVSGSVMFALMSGLYPKLFEDETNGENNP